MIFDGGQFFVPDAGAAEFPVEAVPSFEPDAVEPLAAVALSQPGVVFFL